KLLARWPKLPPLAGNRMLKWLGGAFGEMDGHAQGSLMPPGLAQNLFVTTTDINGYNRQIPIADPPAINTVVNKHVFEFRDRGPAARPPAPYGASAGRCGRACRSCRAASRSGTRSTS